MSGRTAYQKIVDELCRGTEPDGRLILETSMVFCHEITTPPALKNMEVRGCDFVFDPNRIKFMIDHVLPAKDTKTAIQGQWMRKKAALHGIEFLDVGQGGVCHAICAEKGWVRPGFVVIMGDSHTGTDGAFGAFAIGVGTTDIEGGLNYGRVTIDQQKVMKINLVGMSGPNVFSKDVILYIINQLGLGSAKNCVVEYHGEYIDSLSMEARMTIANMTAEFGGTTGMMMVDSKTIDYLWPDLEKEGCLSKAAAYAEYSQWNSDPDAEYDIEHTIDISNLEPLCTVGYKPNEVKKMSEMEGQKIDQIYFGSCTNGRIEDLRAAVHALKKLGKKLAKGVRGIVSPATTDTWKQANKEGLLDVLMDAGFCVTNATCGACLGMSNGVLAPGEVCASTTNRNFNGRMGKGGMLHLMSPVSAIRSGVEGVFKAPEPELMEDFDGFAYDSVVKPTDWEDVEFEKPDYTAHLPEGSVVREYSGVPYFIERADINTDEIISAKFLVEIDREAFGPNLFEDLLVPNHSGKLISLDEDTKEDLRSGEYRILVVKSNRELGKDEHCNFGCGSSREHAPWAIEGCEYTVVIASGFARIFENNMFNNGMICITLPESDVEELYKLAVAECFFRIEWEDGYIEAGDKAYQFDLTETQKKFIGMGGLLNVLGHMAAEEQ